MSEPLWTSSDWTFDLIKKVDDKVAEIAHDEYQLDTYPNQIEIISSDQMLEAYSSHGLPVYYEHWSFGKQLTNQQKSYRRGRMGLAYEIVINSNPCISYLMEENTMTMQALVIAHACYGHNSFFKNNYLFKQWTDADSIVDYLLFAKKYIKECEEKYGEREVENLLDSAHALADYGVDKYEKPRKMSIKDEERRQKSREEWQQKYQNELWYNLVDKHKTKKTEIENFPKEPQENILYFIEKNSPRLKPWQREIIRIVRKVSQYFYPQKQTKLMNEGWASFWHYTIMNNMFDKGLITQGAMIEFLKSHTNVTYQSSFEEEHYNGINVYSLGYNMFQDIKRMCEHPTEEDKRLFPDVAGGNWLETVHHIMRNFRDESFILQYLSPQVIRDMKLIAIDDKNNSKEHIVTSIHDDYGFKKIRSDLSKQYNISYLEPDIYVHNTNLKTDRKLFLQHQSYEDMQLDEKSAKSVIKHVRKLWGYSVQLKSIDNKNSIRQLIIEP